MLNYTIHTPVLERSGFILQMMFHFPSLLSRAHTVRFFKSPLGLYLSDCTNMMIMSHCGISVVINVRLYDSQDELKRVHARKLVRSFTLSTLTRPVTVNCIACGTEMLAIMKSI